MAAVPAFIVDPAGTLSVPFGVSFFIDRLVYIVPGDVMYPPAPIIIKNKTRAWAFYTS